MDEIDVTVCVVNWNCKAVLRGCLESLLHRPQGVRLEVVVVDNASQDGSAELVAAEFPEVVLVRNADNRGFARANNQAARLARGRYLFFLNNDTVVPPGALARLLAYARAHPHVGMIGPRLRGGDGNFQASYRPHPTLASLLHRICLLRWTGLFRRAYRRFRRDEFDPTRTRQVDTLMGAALFVSQEVFRACGPWDEDFTFGGEDLHLSACVGRRHPLVFLPEVEITHFGGVGSRRHAGYVRSAYAAGYARYLRKAGYSRPACFAYKLAVTLDALLLLGWRGVEYAGRRLCGRRRQAEKSLQAWQGARHLLTHGLVAFWRA